MELILIIIIYLAYILIKNYIETGKKPSDIFDDVNKAIIVAEHSTEKKKNKSALDEAYERTIKEQNSTINNTYIQNNIYIQKNYYERSKTYEENKDHSERVWRKLGYRIKRGESYSYRFYGNEIFTPNQVERIGSYEIKYSPDGLVRKLLADTGSVQHTQNILVEDYGLSKSEANNLITRNKF